jgi:hypothetical protein
MPIHDWTRVRSNRFHDFHQSWTIAIRNALNANRLPHGYFALVEQSAGGPESDVITLALIPPADPASGGLAVEIQPPKTRFVKRIEAALRAQGQPCHDPPSRRRRGGGHRNPLAGEQEQPRGPPRLLS